jgi:hypothetical protein
MHETYTVSMNKCAKLRASVSNFSFYLFPFIFTIHSLRQIANGPRDGSVFRNSILQSASNSPESINQLELVVKLLDKLV